MILLFQYYLESFAMAEVKLNVDAYVHKTTLENRLTKFMSGFSRHRLPRGTVMDILEDKTDMKGMTRVKIVIIDIDKTFSVGGWKAGDIGFVRTIKSTQNSGSIKDKTLLSQPSLNGIGGSVGQWGASTSSLLCYEIKLNIAIGMP